jgi:hypothetical protein
MANKPKAISMRLPCLNGFDFSHEFRKHFGSPIFSLILTV